MDWLSGLFKLIGGSQENIEQSRAAADADRQRIGASDQSKYDLYIFGGLILLLIAVLFIYRNK